MEERKPMYEFDLGFMGKVICSEDTAGCIQSLMLVASSDARKKCQGEVLSNAYDEIYMSLYEELKPVGYYR